MIDRLKSKTQIYFLKWKRTAGITTKIASTRSRSDQIMGRQKKRVAFDLDDSLLSPSTLEQKNTNIHKNKPFLRLLLHRWSNFAQNKQLLKLKAKERKILKALKSRCRKDSKAKLKKHKRVKKEKSEKPKEHKDAAVVEAKKPKEKSAVKKSRRKTTPVPFVSQSFDKELISLNTG